MVGCGHIFEILHPEFLLEDRVGHDMRQMTFILSMLTSTLCPCYR